MFGDTERRSYKDESALVAVWGGRRGRAWTVKGKLPGVVGVPVMRPVAERFNPGGRVPEARDQR
jgi:hypothetical protein